MMLPGTEKELIVFAQETTEICQISQAQRAAAYRMYGQWVETGRPAGGLARANMLYSHVDRLRSHLFSPSGLRFNIGYEWQHDKVDLLRAETAERVLNREWETSNIDLTFGNGVHESLTYGACLAKQLVATGSGGVSIGSRLVMPWNFGVYNEGINELDDQEAFNETVYLNEHEVWRRIRHLPDAQHLYRQIMSQGSKTSGVGVPTSFMHQVLSTATLDLSLSNATQPQPGGIVALVNDPNFATLGPQTGANLIPMHELWVMNDETGDYTTIQWIEPGILITPREGIKRSNLFVPNASPYGLIQANSVAGYFWGRSEITDLMMPQELLSTTYDDVTRLMGIQFDKFLGIAGSNLTEELYAAMRNAGFVTLETGATITDLTPKFPPEAMAFIALIKTTMQEISGFSNILSGQGDSGVRAGVHADTLLKTASPRLRDRALLVERQASMFADKTLSALQAKNDKVYWVDPKEPSSDFLLSQLPEDRRVSVDSHSSSPIYQDDHEQRVAFGLKAGYIDPISAIEMSGLPAAQKDLLISRTKESQAAKQQQLQELMKIDPEAAARAMTGRRR